jgi:hypothetical protein
MEQLSKRLLEDHVLGAFLFLINTNWSNRSAMSEFITNYFDFHQTTDPKYWDDIDTEIRKGRMINDLKDIIGEPGFDKIPSSLFIKIHFYSGDWRKQVKSLCKLYKA